MIKSINIGAITYKVKMLPDTTDNQLGACVFKHQTIYLSPNQLHQSASDTLLHEVLHAIWYESGLEYADVLVEETVVRTLSTWLRIVIETNPEFVKFINNSKTQWPYGPKSNPLKDATE